jgi:glyoxylase-like metal-dependent hydrolase (beta-lactamase superfamily II)
MFDGHAYINLDDEFLARNPDEQIKSFIGQDVDIEGYNGELKSIDTLNSDYIIVHKNPGHTKGSVSYEFPNEGLIFTGDFVFKDSIGRTDLFSGSMDQMNTSLRETFLNFEEEFEILPGHGPSGKVRSIKNNNEYIKVLLND